MDNCRKCRIELPLRVRFCPFCGIADPLASVTATASGTAVEPGRVEVARETSPQSAVQSVPVPAASPAETPISQPSQPDHAAATHAQPPVAKPAKSPAGIPVTSPVPVPKPVPVGRWFMLAAAGLAVAAWFARPLFGPSDPCQSSVVSSELDQARTALGARDHRTALSKSTLALTTCTQGQRADELKRIQTEAVILSVAEGRRCLKAMDVPCLERVGSDLALVAQHPTAKAFNADLERDIGTRTGRDIAEAKRCIATGNIDCADQRMKLPLALRRNDTQVQALSEQLDKARAAVEAAKSCQTSSATECVAVALESLRQASPQSPLIRGLEQRARAVEFAVESAPKATDPKAPVVATPTSPQPPPEPQQQQSAPTAAVTSHRVQAVVRASRLDRQGRQTTLVYVDSEFSINANSRTTPRVQEAVWVQGLDGKHILGPALRSPVPSNGRYVSTTGLVLPAEVVEGEYQILHQVILDDVTKSERTERFNLPGTMPSAPHPSAALIQRLVNEGERCRAERDCGCMKDKAVAVGSIDAQNQWAASMRKSASECARAKVEIR